MVNNKSVWEHLIPVKQKVESQSLIEQENARLFCGLSIEQYEQLPGTNYWASEKTSVGIYDSKSDVLCFYRSQKLMEAVINNLNTKEYNK